MTHRTTRRSFLKTSAGVGIAAAGMTAQSYSQVVGSSGDVRIATAGFHGRGKAHIEAWRSLDGVRLVALCDADQKVLDAGVADVAKERKPKKKAEDAPTLRAAKVDGFTDIRKLLDDKSIDAISIASPNHWHSLMAIWACQAGKDVYVEKPVSHCVWEGRKAVEAARKYNRIVQAGTQSRSSGSLREAYKWVQAGNLGKIKIARGLCYKRRPPVAGADKLVPPESVNYDLWCGPATLEQKPRANLHYDWHWYWSTGCGDIGNQGIHEMDKCRWAMGKPTLSPKVMSIGGRMGYTDNAETAATQMVVHDYGDMLLIFEVRGMPGASGQMEKYKGEGIGQVIECEGGYVAGSTAFDNKGKKIQDFKGKGESHFGNFIKAVRSRKVEDLNADILEGHLSSALCHTGNVSYRLGKKAPQGEIRERIKGDKAALETFERMVEHLKVNHVDLDMDQASIGPVLAMDVQAERFTGEHEDEANKLVKDPYRSPYVVPYQV